MLVASWFQNSCSTSVIPSTFGQEEEKEKGEEFVLRMQMLPPKLLSSTLLTTQ